MLTKNIAIIVLSFALMAGSGLAQAEGEAGTSAVPAPEESSSPAVRKTSSDFNRELLTIEENVNSLKECSVQRRLSSC
ncbi:MAG: hypothetical protein ACPGTU_12735 [Myxococcota bacterium]